jgi:hypothetical protein
MASNIHPDRIPVLLTSSVVAHDTSVALKDTDERIRLAIESVAQWLKIEPTTPLVLCDGSNFDFSDSVRLAFPNANIECLYFGNDQEKIHQFGRGYGEGEIIHYALDHSQFINTAGCFAKCTSKLWVENFKQCIAEWNGKFLCKGVFLNVFSPFKETAFSYIDTRFYISDTQFYRQYFQNSHLNLGYRNGKFFSIEDSFFEIFLREEFEQMLFSTPPVVCGVGGGTGKHYKNTTTRQLKERLRFRLVQMKSEYSQLFNRTLRK